MEKKTLKISIICFILLLLILGYGIFRLSTGATHNLTKGVTVSSVRSVKLGMSRAEVIKILGTPVSEGPSQIDKTKITMNYSESVLLARWYPMLWVHFRDDKVISVFAKRYYFFGADDKVIYNDNLDKNPVFESPLFEESFPE